MRRVGGDGRPEVYVTLLVSPCVGWTCFRNYVFSCDHSRADYLSLLYFTFLLLTSYAL